MPIRRLLTLHAPLPRQMGLSMLDALDVRMKTAGVKYWIAAGGLPDYEIWVDVPEGHELAQCQPTPQRNRRRTDPGGPAQPRREPPELGSIEDLDASSDQSLPLPPTRYAGHTKMINVQQANPIMDGPRSI